MINTKSISKIVKTCIICIVFTICAGKISYAEVSYGGYVKKAEHGGYMTSGTAIWFFFYEVKNGVVATYPYIIVVPAPDVDPNRFNVYFPLLNTALATGCKVTVTADDSIYAGGIYKGQLQNVSKIFLDMNDSYYTKTTNLIKSIFDSIRVINQYLRCIWYYLI